MPKDYKLKMGKIFFCANLWCSNITMWILWFNVCIICFLNFVYATLSSCHIFLCFNPCICVHDWQKFNFLYIRLTVIIYSLPLYCSCHMEYKEWSKFQLGVHTTPSLDGEDKVCIDNHINFFLKCNHGSLLYIETLHHVHRYDFHLFFLSIIMSFCKEYLNLYWIFYDVLFF